MAGFTSENGAELDVYSMARREGLVRIAITTTDAGLTSGLPIGRVVEIDLTPEKAKALSTRLGRVAKQATPYVAPSRRQV